MSSPSNRPSPNRAGSASRAVAQAQEAQRRAEQELHQKNLRLHALESDLTNAKDTIARRDAEIERLRTNVSSPMAGGGGSGGDRSKLREDAVRSHWQRELALLELQEQVARNLMLDAARDSSLELFADSCVELGRQQGEESATERVRHRINTLTFQLRITQTVQVRKLREQIAELSARLNDPANSKEAQQATSTMKKELAAAEKARLDLATRLSDANREMRDHRQNSVTALNEAQKWEAEAKKLKSQLQQAEQELRDNRQNADGGAGSSSSASGGVGELEMMEHQRQMSEMQLLIDDLQSQVAASGQRLSDAERKIRTEREKASSAIARSTELEKEIAVLRSETTAPERRMTEIQRHNEQLSEHLAEHRIALSSEKQQREKAVADKDKTIDALQKNLTALQQAVSSQGTQSATELTQARSKLADAERALAAERSLRASENSSASSRINELEEALSKTNDTTSNIRNENQQRYNDLELQYSQLQAQLSKAEAHNFETERKLTVSERRATELERDLAIKVEQFSLMSQKSASSNNQTVALNKAQTKLDGARHSIAMLLLAQQYQGACINLYTDAVANTVEANRIERETKLIRDLQAKQRDQVQSLELRHASQLEDVKRHHRRLSDVEHGSGGGGGSPTSGGSVGDEVVVGGGGGRSSSSSGGGGAGGGGLVFPPSPMRGGGAGGAGGMLAMQMALERKAFSHLASLDLVANHFNTMTRTYIDSFILISSRENDDLSRKLREQATDYSGLSSGLESKVQILTSEKAGLQSQLNSTQQRYEERVAYLTAEVKDGARREKELKEKLATIETEQRRMSSRLNSSEQEKQQLQNYAEDLKTSRELERSVLHARIQAAEEAKARSDGGAGGSGGSGASGGGGAGTTSDMLMALEAAHTQVAKEHAQVVELEGTVSELKAGMLKERRSRAALEATHREELAVLEQRLGEVRAELAALQLQQNGMDDDAQNETAGGTLSRPHLQRELKTTQERLVLATDDLQTEREKTRELERKIAVERDNTVTANDRTERTASEADHAKKDLFEIKKELDGVRSRHAAELIAREAEFGKSRKKLLDTIEKMQEEQNSLKLQLHTQQMEHMSALHQMERHCVDRIAAAEGEAASSNRGMYEELQDRKDRVQMLEKKNSSLTAQLDNRDQLLKTAQDHLHTLQAERNRSDRSDEDEVAHYRQELKDLSNALVDAKRSQIAAADRSRHIMATTEQELNQLHAETSQLRSEIVDLESKHRSELALREANYASGIKELKASKEQFDAYKEKTERKEKEHTAETAELRKRIESLLKQVATEDVLLQLKQTQHQADVATRKHKESETVVEKLSSDRIQLEAEVERLHVRTKQLQIEQEEAEAKIKKTEALVDKKVEHAVGNFQRKVEVEAQLWHARAESAGAENSQLRRLLLEEQRTSKEAAERIAQLEIALDELELEFVAAKAAAAQQQYHQSGSSMMSSVRRRGMIGDRQGNSSPTTVMEEQEEGVAGAAALDTSGFSNLSNTTGPYPMSIVRRRLVELPSLQQIIAAKQTACIDMERLEFERRTEIEADVFEWRWAVQAFANILQSAFHSFSMQLFRAQDHATNMETEVSQLENDVRGSLAISRQQNKQHESTIARWELTCEETEARNALLNFASYQWVDAARMFARELAAHGRGVTGTSKRLLVTNAALVQQQRDMFLFQRKQLQDFEMDNRHSLGHATAESLFFFDNMFRFTRCVIHSYEKKVRTLTRRLSLVISTERDVSDLNMTILTRKAQHHQNIQNQIMMSGPRSSSSSASNMMMMMQQQSPAVALFANNNNNNTGISSVMSPSSAASPTAGSSQGGWAANTLDTNLKALPEFRRPELARSPLEIVQRDELVQRRLLQDMLVDWVSSIVLTMQRTGGRHSVFA